MQARILLTGANGFVGRALLKSWRAAGIDAVGAVRAGALASGDALAPGLSADADWGPLLIGRDVVVHAAARAHVLQESEADPLAVYRHVNTAATLSLARQAAAAGVRRFVFVSSIKVIGEGRALPYRETDPPAPQDAYAVSKREAEAGLFEIARETGLEVVVLRPPLIYGPGVGANFLRLMQWVRRGVPLPFGSVNNRRSLLYLGNLVDAVSLCIEHPAAANQSYLVSDGEDVSTPELIRLLAGDMGKPARLIPVPPAWLVSGASLLGKRQEMQRLLGSLAVDSGKIRRELGWSPPFSLADGLRATVNDFMRHG